MSHRILCIEPGSRPATVRLEVGLGEPVQVCLLEDAEAEGGPGSASRLRHTILRRSGEALPAGAVPVLEAAVERGQLGGPPGVRVLAVGSQPVELVRGEVRSRLRPGVELKEGTRLELALPELRRVEFQLLLEAQAARGAQAAIAGSGTRRSQVRAASTGLLWLIPSVWSVMADFLAWKVAQARALGRRFGLSPRTIAVLIAVSFVVLMNVGIVLAQLRKTTAAEERAQGAEAAAEEARAAAQAALLGELTCLAEREGLVAELGEEQQQRAVRAERALELSAARAVALERGGTRMGSEAVLAFDQQLRPELLAQAVAEQRRVGEVPRELSPCTEQQALLGSDLPAYALLYHPSAELTCPTRYSGVLGGAELAGRWGLSERVAREFGPEAVADRDRTALLALDGVRAPDPAVAEALADPRLEDRWAAQTYTAALRDIQGALLGSRAGDRVPVAPGQSQLWTLALFHAVNTLPSPAEGVGDAPAAECVADVLSQLAREAAPAAPGEPLLPDLVAVALAETRPVLTPRPGCPWAEDALGEGARAALLAVGRQGVALGQDRDG